MKFELKYADNTTTIIEVDNAEIRSWLGQKAQASEATQFQKDQATKGNPVVVIVKP